MNIKASIRKHLLPLLLCVSLLAGLTTVAAAASAAGQAVSAQLRPDFTILIDGAERTFYNAGGQEVHPILYDGTTYLPVRAIGELMGRNVDWNQATLTVTLAGERTTAAVNGTPDANAARQDITAQLRPDFTIVVDGTVRTFADVSGQTVYPLLYSGSTYLPIRAIGGLMGKTVGWDAATSTVTLTGDSLVTDADSFGGGGGTTAPTTPATPSDPSTGSDGLITLDQAKANALSHAGLNASQVTFAEARLDREDGRQIYDIEFYTADYQEYDYEIDANTGAVLSFDYDAEFYIRPSTPPTTPGSGSGSGQITADEAKEIALNHAGKTAGEVIFLRAQLDWDDGRAKYDVEFVSGTIEYDLEIDANTGAVLEYDTDSIYD